MFGAIIGDMAGSIYEGHNIRTKDFPFFKERSHPTDDSIMTVAVAKAILENDGRAEGLGEKTVEWMRKIGCQYHHAGYGGGFRRWLRSENPEPYNSWGNGAAMRVSACGWAAASLENAKELSRAVTEVTHNHPEGIKGAEAVACCIYLAKTGSSKEEIRAFIEESYYGLFFSLAELRAFYSFDVSCQGTVPPAIIAFLESTDFEDAIRNAISLGGDSDTVAAITGSIAEAYYGIPDELASRALKQYRFAVALRYTEAYITQDPDLTDVVEAFEKRFCEEKFRTLTRALIAEDKELSEQ